jgi:hypothetical protein
MTSTPFTQRRLSHRARLTLPALAAAGLLLRDRVQVASAQDASELLRQAADTMTTLSSFHFELSTHNGKTQFIEGIELDSVTGDVLRPLSLKAEATIGMALASIKLTIISIDGHTWVTDPFSSSGEFRDLGTADFGVLDPTILINPDRLILPAIGQVHDPVIAGTEKIGDTDTTRIDGTVDMAAAANDLIAIASPGAGTPEVREPGEGEIAFPESMPFSVWIDGSNQVHRIEVTGAILENEANDIVRRIDLSNFNESVDIQPPTQ